ncbi:MAG: DNA-deoxyinosine glycosylase [Rhodocyclaceae bacterium]|nr:DNA-deoxyinosine glycosylase [Rhodocyclaceae bacterium]
MAYETSAPRESLVGLPPLLQHDTEILILGSFPSSISLSERQYYANSRNQFWKILGAVTGSPLHQMDYDQRWPLLLATGIGLWDVYASCEREGSLDSDIRMGVPNDFASLATRAPKLKRVCFNGQTAGKFQRLFWDMGYTVLVLPSTSPAYTLAFERKLAAWRAAL